MNETRFDGMGKIYAQFRPSYPREFLDYLYSGIGMNKNSVISDIGSGTGKLTRQLLENGGKIFAVEPNPDMRAVAEAGLRGFPGFVSVNGTAENTTLADNSVDFITVAQAFHWFDRAAFKTECQRILKPNNFIARVSKIILVWNRRDNSSELVRENDALNEKYCPNFKGRSGNMRGAENDDDFKDFFTGSYEIKTFRNDQPVDEQEFIGRNLSSSYAPKENDKGYQPYIAELKALFDKYNNNGQVVMSTVTHSYSGSC